MPVAQRYGSVTGWFRVPPWFGARLRRALAAGPLVAALVLGGGWPYWTAHRIAAAVTMLSCAIFATAGVLLMSGRRGRRTGSLFLFASVAWAVNWTAGWNTGPTPLLSVFAQSAFYLAVTVGVLLYPAGRLDRLADRLWTMAAFAVLVGGQLVMCLTSRPEWTGFHSSVIWPTLIADRAVFQAVLLVNTILLIMLVAALTLLLLLRLPRLTGLEGAFAAPVTLGVAFVAVASTVAQGSVMNDQVELDQLLRTYVLQGAFAIALPITFLAGGLRSRLAELTVAERMLRPAAPVSVEGVRDALRKVLHDETLDLWFWVPQDRMYVDVAGRPMAEAAEAQGRWRHEVRTQRAEPLAVVEVAASLRDHASLVEAALVAGGQALETAQLQATAQAHLEQARAAQERLVRVQTVERERLGRDLQRSAEQRLRSLAARLERVAALTSEPSAQEAFQACHAELVEAMSELGALARGVHPEILTSEGIGPALRQIADRAGPPVQLDIPGERFQPEIEATLYFAVCEALTNALKHAQPSAVRILVHPARDAVVAEVSDDGVGAPQLIAGAEDSLAGRLLSGRPADTGGLSGIIDRVRALRGHVEISSIPGKGTTVRISLPR